MKKNKRYEEEMSYDKGRKLETMHRRGLYKGERSVRGVEVCVGGGCGSLERMKEIGRVRVSSEEGGAEMWRNRI